MEIKDWCQCFLSFFVLWISIALKKMNKNKLLCSSRYVVLLRRIPVGSLLLGKPFQVFGYQVQLIPARPKPFAKADLRGYVKDQLSTGLTKHLALSQLLIHF